MHKYLLAILVAAGVFLTACPTATTTAHVVVKFANDTSPLLLKWYEEEGNEAIAEINCADNLDCDAALTAAGDRIDARWENVWIAWQLLTVARDTYETTLEAGGKPDAMALEQAYCGLLTTIPKEYKERLTLLSVRCP